MHSLLMTHPAGFNEPFRRFNQTLVFTHWCNSVSHHNGFWVRRWWIHQKRMLSFRYSRYFQMISSSMSLFFCCFFLSLEHSGLSIVTISRPWNLRAISNGFTSRRLAGFIRRIPPSEQYGWASCFQSLSGAVPLTQWRRNCRYGCKPARTFNLSAVNEHLWWAGDQSEGAFALKKKKWRVKVTKEFKGFFFHRY